MEGMKQHITKDQWLQLNGNERRVIREAFSIGRSENPQVIDDRVVSDGVSVHDLSLSLNVENMSRFLGRKGECDELWEALKAELLKVERPGDAEPMAQLPPEPATDTPDAPKAKKPKKSKK